jgi:hypothetical protein
VLLPEVANVNSVPLPLLRLSYQKPEWKGDFFFGASRRVEAPSARQAIQNRGIDNNPKRMFN